MSAKQFSGLVASILGFVILIIGSLGYMDVFALSDTLSYMLMGVGIIMVISALAFISLMGRKEELTSLKEECDMGLMDKLKSLFKKGDKKDAAPKLNGTKMEAVQFKGEGRVPDALRSKQASSMTRGHRHSLHSLESVKHLVCQMTRSSFRSDRSSVQLRSYNY